MSSEPRTHRATRALQRVRDGVQGASEELFEIVYDDLHELAERVMVHERSGHTLQPTALVHEAYLRLFEQHDVAWRDRRHFFGVAARGIRQILVQHARDRAAQKRGGNLQRVVLGDESDGHQVSSAEFLELDVALERLAALDERQARVVDLRFFGGLSIADTAELLGVSERTVKGDWQVARLWLRREMGGGAEA